MEELRLVYESGLRAFPPRLVEQPIFYPVLNFGYVTRFEVDEYYVSNFERHVVGGREHEELWVPAEQLDEFNENIVGNITVVSAYFGPRFRGHVPNRCSLEGKDAVGQFVLLTALLRDDDARFRVVIFSSHEPVFLHYLFWKQRSFFDVGVPDCERDRTLLAVEDVWSEAFPSTPLTIPLR